MKTAVQNSTIERNKNLALGNLESDNFFFLVAVLEIRSKSIYFDFASYSPGRTGHLTSPGNPTCCGTSLNACRYTSHAAISSGGVTSGR
jgi:hypothetical protein